MPVVASGSAGGIVDVEVRGRVDVDGSIVQVHARAHVHFHADVRPSRL